MRRITLHAGAFLLAVPLMAQVTVTSVDGGPGTYVPLAQNYSVLNSSELSDASTPEQMQMAILQQSAVIHNAIIQGLPSAAGTSGVPGILAGTPQSFTQTPAPKSTSAAIPAVSAAASYTPPPFNSLANSVAFIQHQIADSSYGLPQTYYEPPGVTANNSVIDSGVGTYDTSLALIALIQSGDLSQAQKILDIYNSGQYGNTVLSAYPTGNNGGAFAPLDSSAYYYFDIADATGKYDQNWNQYGSHTGPNAWLALAACQYIQAERKVGVSNTVLAPYLTMVSRIGNAMLTLQDSQTQGAVRYGPHQTYEDPYNTVNTENNVDAYSAFNSIAEVMQQSTLSSFSSTASNFSNASGKIINWLKNGSFYNPETGQMQTGMRDPQSGLLFMGADFDSQNNRWQLETQLAEDSGGSWTISALGPKMIDSMWGKGTALAMWEAIRSNFGRTETQSGNPSTISEIAPGDTLDGLDYSNIYSSNQALISPEWTAGGINAVNQLITYYKTMPPTPPLRPIKGISPSPLLSLSADLRGMKGFLSQGQDAYAIGPGLAGSRQGNTGFGWQAPLNSSVAAMASIYGTLGQDPLTAWRSTAP